ncbi:MAG: class I SAM-dependent methyltransferase [Candidatus Moranbacteria bacterium]|nr:class I SAM-dependent methyltransferase [Candidatus Moranbacteria bacterium]
MKENFDKKYFSSGSYKSYKKLVDAWVPIVAKKINKIIGDKPMKILDVGCAHGYLIAELQNKYGHDVWGIDYSPYAVKNSEKSVRKNIRQGDILKLPFKKNNFDVVISLDVINYLEEKDIPVAVKNLVGIAKRHIFFGAIFKHAWTASQKWNPDKFRRSVLAKKEYIEIFKKSGAKFAGSFDGENGGTILVLKK